ncbi:MAG: TetR/AcrR family transcriptional regulator [Myxococcota bacterium]
MATKDLSSKSPSAKGERTRQRILDAALSLFAERGYGQTTVRAIADRAGCATGLLYRYFPRREALVLALYERLSLDLVSDVATLPPGTVAARFSWLMRKKLEKLQPHRDAFVGLAAAALDPASELHVLSEASAGTRARVEALFQKVVEGSEGSADPVALGRMLFVLHLLVLLVWTQDPSDGQAHTSELLAIAAEGLTFAIPMMALPMAKPGVERLYRLVGEFYRGEADTGEAPPDDEVHSGA